MDGWMCVCQIDFSTRPSSYCARPSQAAGKRSFCSYLLSQAATSFLHRESQVQASVRATNHERIACRGPGCATSGQPISLVRLRLTASTSRERGPPAPPGSSAAPAPTNLGGWGMDGAAHQAHGRFSESPAVDARRTDGRRRGAEPHEHDADTGVDRLSASCARRGLRPLSPARKP